MKINKSAAFAAFVLVCLILGGASCPSNNSSSNGPQTSQVTVVDASSGSALDTTIGGNTTVKNLSFGQASCSTQVEGNGAIPFLAKQAGTSNTLSSTNNVGVQYVNNADYFVFVYGNDQNLLETAVPATEQAGYVGLHVAFLGTSGQNYQAYIVNQQTGRAILLGSVQAGALNGLTFYTAVTSGTYYAQLRQVGTTTVAAQSSPYTVTSANLGGSVFFVFASQTNNQLTSFTAANSEQGCIAAGGGTSGGMTAPVEVLNLDQSTQDISEAVDAKVGSTTVATNVAEDSISSVGRAPAGTNTANFYLTGSSASIATKSLSLSSSDRYVLVLGGDSTGNNQATRTIGLVDFAGNTRPASGQSQVTLIDTTSTFSSIDIYLLTQGQTVANSQPTLAGAKLMQYKTVTLNVPTGTNVTYSLVATLPGTKTVIGGPTTETAVSGESAIDALVLPFQTTTPNFIKVDEPATP